MNYETASLLKNIKLPESW